MFAQFLCISLCFAQSWQKLLVKILRRKLRAPEACRHQAQPTSQKNAHAQPLGVVEKGRVQPPAALQLFSGFIGIYVNLVDLEPV